VHENGVKTEIKAETIEELEKLEAALKPLQTYEGERRLLEQIPPKARQLIEDQAPLRALLAREPRSDEERVRHMVERVMERRKAGVRHDEAFRFAVAEQFAKAPTSPWLMQMAAYELRELYEPKRKAVQEKETQPIRDRAMAEATAVGLRVAGHRNPMGKAWELVAKTQGLHGVGALKQRHRRERRRRERRKEGYIFSTKL
jgi:hypothetical protein